MINRLLMFVLLSMLSLIANSQTILFSEDFTAEAVGATNGTSTEGVNWTASCPTCAAGDWFEIQDTPGLLKGLQGFDTS